MALHLKRDDSKAVLPNPDGPLSSSMPSFVCGSVAIHVRPRGVFAVGLHKLVHVQFIFKNACTQFCQKPNQFFLHYSLCFEAPASIIRKGLVMGDGSVGRFARRGGTTRSRHTR